MVEDERSLGEVTKKSTVTAKIMYFENKLSKNRIRDLTKRICSTRIAKNGKIYHLVDTLYTKT